MKRRIGIIIAATIVALVIAFGWWLWPQPLIAPHQEEAGSVNAPAAENNEWVQKATRPAVVATPSPSPSPDIVFVGPRENIPEDAPVAYGFWSFAIPVPGVLSRSGQPLIGEFRWLREQGWKGVVNLRVDGERDEVGDDAKIPGFNELGFNYLPLPIIDGHPLTDEQAKKFLEFVINPANQPTHVHCRGGIGRAGTAVVLYRYAVDGWPLDKAIEESRPFRGGISDAQKRWLEKWAAAHPPGEYRR